MSSAANPTAEVAAGLQSQSPAWYERAPYVSLLGIWLLTRAVTLGGLLAAKHGDLGAALGNGATHTYDAAWYDLIVLHGYQDPHLGSPITIFYPGYPAAVAAVYWPLKSLASLFVSGADLQHLAETVLLPIAVLAVCNLALIATLALLWRLYAARLGRTATFFGIALLLAAPTGFFLSVGYSESLFLVAAVGAFLLAERGRWRTAGLAAGLAALIRFPGAFLLIPLAILWWQAGRPRPRLAAVGAVLAVVGALAFPAWLWVQSGDPLAYLHLQGTHHRFLSEPWLGVSWVLSQALGALLMLVGQASPIHRVDIPTVLANALALLAAAATLVLGWRLLKAAELAWVAIVFVVPLLSGTGESLDRYWLAAFPVFFLFGWWLRRGPMLATVMIGASSVWLFALAYNFGRGIWAG
jgi:hypothetical protein